MGSRNGLDATFKGEIFRKDHPMILASLRHLASIKAVRLEEGTYKAGQVVSYDSNDGLYKDFSTVSGSLTADAILFADVESSESGDEPLERAIFGGEVFKSKLIDLNSQAETNLGGRTIVDAEGTEIYKF